MADTVRTVEVAIIGAGTAGLSALAEVEKTTRNVVLIQDGVYGTTCARVGCMPSKVLLQIAKDFHRRELFSQRGITGAESLALDSRAAMGYVRKLRDHFVSGVLKTVDKIGDRNIKGRARFLDASTLQVGEVHLRAKSILIATGSHPVVPEAWKAFSSDILTSDTLFEMESLPSSIAVVGLGTIGLEIGQALSRLGVKVIGVGRSPNLGGIEAPALQEKARKVFSKSMTLWLGSEATLESDPKGIRVRAGNQSAVVEKVFASLGRKPNTQDLGLEKLGMKLGKDGVPEFDRQTLQIPGFPIFIAGDVNEDRTVLHEAADEGRIAGFNATLSSPQCFQRRTPLTITFTDPCIAKVGEVFSAVPKSVVIGEVHFENQGRSVILGQNEGMLRVYIDESSGRILGSEILAPEGENLAHYLAALVQRKTTVFEALQMPIYHPTVMEGLRTALRDAARKVKNQPKRFELALCESSPLTS